MNCLIFSYLGGHTEILADCRAQTDTETDMATFWLQWISHILMTTQSCKSEQIKEKILKFKKKLWVHQHSNQVANNFSFYLILLHHLVMFLCIYIFFYVYANLAPYNILRKISLMKESADKTSDLSHYLETFQIIRKLSSLIVNFSGHRKTFQIIWNIPDHPKLFYYCPETF